MDALYLGSAALLVLAIYGLLWGCKALQHQGVST